MSIEPMEAYFRELVRIEDRAPSACEPRCGPPELRGPRHRQAAG